MNFKVWLVRPLPNGKNHMQDFLEEDVIGVGYPIGVDFTDYNYNEIKDKLEENDMTEGITNVNTIVNSMNIGDIILVPNDNKKDVYFCEVSSNYKYESTSNDYPHRRFVKWLFDKTPLQRNSLPEEIRGSLRYPGGVAELTKHKELVSKILSGSTSIDNVSLDEKAIKVLETLLDNENPNIQLEAAKIVLNKN